MARTANKSPRIVHKIQQSFISIFICLGWSIKVSSKHRDMNGGEESPKMTVIQDKDFILDCLCWHNEYRARHAAPALTVSTEVSFVELKKRVFPEGTFLTDEKFCGQTMAPFLCSGIIQVQVWWLFSSGMNPRNFTTPNVECDRRILYANKTILIHIFMQLCEWAQNWANHLASTNEFYYRSDKNLGQNLFCCPISALVTDLTGQEVASYWYSTVRRYNYFKEPRLLHTNVNAGKCYSN